VSDTEPPDDESLFRRGPADPGSAPTESLRIYGPGDKIGDAWSAPLEVVEIIPDDGPPGRPDRDEIVRLIIKLRPQPPGHERWWWVRRVAGEGRGVIGSSYNPSVDTFTVQFNAPRDGMAETVIEVRAAVAAANRDYPDQYLVDAQAAAERKSQIGADRQARVDADKAVIDEAMRRPLDEP